jgi:hypothetical protein
MEVKGDTPAVKLARWYVNRVGIGRVPDRRTVHLIKTIIELAGSREKATTVIQGHLSDRFRFREQKPLEFILSKLRRETGTLVPVPVAVNVGGPDATPTP